MLLAALAIATAQKPAPEALAQAQDAFGLKVLLATAKPGANTVVSPNNLLYAFAGLYPASTGESRRALAAALGVSGVTEDDQLAALRAVFKSPGFADEQLEAAAAAWIDDEIKPDPTYIDSIRRRLDYDVRNFDLQAPTALGEINGWVKTNTHDKIPTILEEMPRGALMVLTSALYYKAPWVQKMTVYDEPLLFGEAKVPARQMGMGGELAHVETPTFRGVAIPFKGDGVAEIYLPKGDHTPEHIAAATIQKHDWSHKRTVLRMPFWKAEFFESMKEPLKQAGLGPLFEPRDELPKIARDVWVLDAFHRTWIDMNENGVEAAAATAVVVGRTSAPIGEPVRFTVDRPFFVVIRKRSTGAALFMGFVYKPTTLLD